MIVELIRINRQNASNSLVLRPGTFLFFQRGPKMY